MQQPVSHMVSTSSYLQGNQTTASSGGSPLSATPSSGVSPKPSVLPIIHVHHEGPSISLTDSIKTISSTSTPSPNVQQTESGALTSERLSADDISIQRKGCSEIQGHDDPISQYANDDLSAMPVMGAKFKTRMAFETACRSAIPETADYCFRIWKSLEVETSRRYGKNAFVELGCRHLDNTKCSSATFRVRAVHNKEGEWYDLSIT